MGGKPGADRNAQGEGSGGGLMQSARPVGALVVKGSEVSWRPAVDVNRIILGGQIVAVVGLLVLRSFLKSRKRRMARPARVSRAARMRPKGQMSKGLMSKGLMSKAQMRKR